MMRTALIIIVSMFFYACHYQSSDTQQEKKVPEHESETEQEAYYRELGKMHNARNSIDYGGRYYGVLPCADCAGIETSLTINYDGTFILQSAYMGKDEAVFEDKGNYHWQDCGNIIVLEATDRPLYYFISENHVVHLDQCGERITGVLADKYILEKVFD